MSEYHILHGIFKGRCPKCRKVATEIHELEPRSRGKEAMRLTNRTAIDRECHEEYHRQGASLKQIKLWKGYIETYLKAIGTWDEYISTSEQ